MVERFGLKVLTDRKTTVMIPANSEMKGEEFIKAVAQESHYDAADVLLYYGDEKIAGNNTLRSLGISSLCTIQMFYRQSIAIRVIVENGSAKSVRINSGDTFESLKAMIEQRLGQSIRKSGLDYNGSLISAGQNLFALGIKEHETIHAKIMLDGGAIGQSQLLGNHS